MKVKFAKMNNKFNWEDLRLILAIHQTGSLSGAGRSLGVSHATIFRRLGDIEKRMGVSLFERSRTGYTPTLAGEESAQAAKKIADIVDNIERQIQGRDLSLSGLVRITTTDSLFLGFLSPIFKQLQAAYPDIQLEISLSNELYSLTRREADIAIRPCLKPPEHLIGRKAASLHQAVYGHKDIFSGAEHADDLHQLNWVGPDQSMMYQELEVWLEKNAYADLVKCRVNSLIGMAATVHDGVGITVLPCYLGDSDPELIRISSIIPELSTDLWLLSHSDLRKNARMKAVSKYLFSQIYAHRGQLTGKK